MYSFGNETEQMKDSGEASDSDSGGLSLSVKEETNSDLSSDGPFNEGNNILQGIEDIITRLYRFTSVARKPAISNERDRVFRYIQNRDLSLELSELRLYIEW